MILLHLAAAASISVAADFSGQRGFSAAFGGEYQFISQEYYNAILDTTNVDPIEVWRLDQDQINDFIFRTNLGYNYKTPTKGGYLLADMELSGDRLIGRSEGSFLLGNYNNNLKLLGKFETKSANGNTDYRVEEFTYYQAVLSGRRRLSDPVSLEFKTGFENVTFSDKNSVDDGGGDSLVATFLNFDYSLFSTAFGGEFTLSEFVSSLTWRAGWTYRAVPDSAAAEYDRFRLDLGYHYFSFKTVISLEGGVEFRNYAQPDGRDDFTEFAMRGRLSRDFDDRYRAGVLLSTDLYRYRSADVINRDYTRFVVEVNGAYRHNGLGAGPVLRWEERSEGALEDDIIESFSESYSQKEAGIQAEFLDTRALFMDAELTYGRRNYHEGEGLLSSYNLWSISLLASCSIFKNISVDGMFDGTLERHSEESDNANLFLLSIGVTARF